MTTMGAQKKLLTISTDTSKGVTNYELRTALCRTLQIGILYLL